MNTYDKLLLDIKEELTARELNVERCSHDAYLSCAKCLSRCYRQGIGVGTQSIIEVAQRHLKNKMGEQFSGGLDSAAKETRDTLKELLTALETERQHLIDNSK